MDGLHGTDGHASLDFLDTAADLGVEMVGGVQTKVAFAAFLGPTIGWAGRDARPLRRERAGLMAPTAPHTDTLVHYPDIAVDGIDG